eukprot:754318-Hanusia_phi.AAC.2
MSRGHGLGRSRALMNRDMLMYMIATSTCFDLLQRGIREEEKAKGAQRQARDSEPQAVSA